ncbi:RrF2 family transcriptional regulator [Advenella sp. RU8]|uniref:RrF2 family transcriptional regulator n=1 Tax=Advenella sp. RU8 TaxID=3399575 RepID=UPI003AABB1A2
MRLTVRTDYAFRMLLYLAVHSDRLCTIKEIADAYHISEPHLMKITHQLGQLEWIETIRGKGGGMKLAKKPEEICLAEVVKTVEPDFHLVECFSSDNTCSIGAYCGLTGIMHEALDAFISCFAKYTLADILKSGMPSSDDSLEKIVNFMK